MRTQQIYFRLLLLLLVLAVPVFAQEAAETEEEADSEIDSEIAIWWNEFQDESSKAEEYGELPEGFLINDFKALFDFKDDRFINVRGERVGLNNAFYSFDYGVEGDYRFFLNYRKIPHLFSREGETIWTESSPGVWTLADGLQQSIQNINPLPPSDPNFSSGLNAQRAFVSALLDGTRDQFLGLQRNQTNAGLMQSVSDRWNYALNYQLENRDGYRPFGTAFAFSWITELPETIDYSTQRFRASTEYLGNGKSFSVSYDLGLFNNDLSAFRWDNPLRLVDRTYDTPGAAYSNGDGTSTAQLQLPPDSTSNTISFGGAAKLGSGRLTGAFAYTLWSAEVDLLPFTVNNAIEPIPLPASTFNGDQKNLNLNLRYNTPVGSAGDFTAGFRLYDHNNSNDVFNIGQYVRLDQNLEPLHRFDCDPAANTCTEISNPPTPLFEYSSSLFSLDFGWRLGNGYRAFVGYQFESWDREHRDVEQSDINRIKFGLDALASDWATFRFSYQYSKRESDEFEVDNPTYLVIPLRRYDIANVNQNLVRAQADFSLSEATTVGVAFSLTNNDYADTLFGLQKWDEYSVGFDFSHAIRNFIINAWYEHAEMERDQQGRQSGSSAATSPTFDWSVNLLDKYDTLGAGFNAPFMNAKANCDLNISYSFADGNADFAAGSSVRPTGAVSFDEVDDTDLFSIRTGLNFKAFPRTRFGFFYWYEKYMIDDFAEDEIQTDLIFLPNPTGAPFVGGTITLNPVQPDYEFHSGWVGFMFNW
jgi:MtrB/PioB family decaheme-associated outer membrane protein